MRNFHLFLACVLMLVAAGIGFAVRSDALGAWEAEFGFTKTQLGQISGAGLWGFAFAIPIMALLVEKMGYKVGILVAFVLHLLSAAMTYYAPSAFASGGKESAFSCLHYAMWLFAFANGTCEAIMNPMVAALVIDKGQTTKWMNYLHTGWPIGLLIGGIAAFALAGQVSWQVQMILYLIPTLAYGIMVFPVELPRSEAGKAGVPIGTMIGELFRPIVIVLLVIQAGVGFAELGTGGWITNLMTNLAGIQGIIVFIYMQVLVTALRFCAGWVESKLNPVQIIAAGAVLAILGLLGLANLSSAAEIFVSTTVFSVGIAYWWPTSLALMSHQSPRGGSVTMGAVGFAGMLSAGLLASPLIGYWIDAGTVDHLKSKAPAVYETYASADANGVFGLPAVAGLDGSKVAALKAATRNEQQDLELKAIDQANLNGGRTSLGNTAWVPGIMLVLALVLGVYFTKKGGYTHEQI